jgi:hypothetical protein
MTFVFPGFLWALAALSIPVIIHLFNFQRFKKVYFTNVRFLRQLQEETRSRSRLKEWLVLAARCLALAAMVLAFAQPVIPDESAGPAQSGARAVSIYIDNSFSMENVNRQGPLLEIAKTRARELVNTLGGADKFQVITNDFQGRHQRFHTKEDAIRVIDDIRISPAVRKLTEVIDRQTEFLRSSPLKNRRIYAFTDAQRSAFNLSDLRPDTAVSIGLVPLAGNRINNVYIDSCWFESPLQQKGFIQKLHARIRNKGEAVIEVGSAKLFLNDKQVAIASYSLAAGADTEVLFTFECRDEGFNYGSVRIEDFPITFDDEFFFAFSSELHVSVCLINGREVQGANPLSALFSGDSLFRTRAMPEQAIDFSAFRNSDMLVLNQLTALSSGLASELLKFTAQGGVIVIIPPPAVSMPEYNTALSSLGLPQLGSEDTSRIKLAEIPSRSGFFQGVFERTGERINLPLVNRHYQLVTGSRRDFEQVLSLQNGNAFLGFSRLNNATVYLFSTPLSDASTNFARHALFVPAFYQLGFQSLRSAPLYYEVSANALINVRNETTRAEAPPHIVSLDGKTDVIPGMRVINNSLFLLTQGQIAVPGYYAVKRDTARLLPLAFNYSRLESDLAAFDEGAIADLIAAGGHRSVHLIRDADTGIPKQALLGGEGRKLWKLFIFLALIFLAVETALLRLLK